MWILIIRILFRIFISDQLFVQLLSGFFICAPLRFNNASELDFPGGPAVKTLGFRCRWQGCYPGRGNSSCCAVHTKRKKKKKGKCVDSHPTPTPCPASISNPWQTPNCCYFWFGVSLSSALGGGSSKKEWSVESDITLQSDSRTPDFWVSALQVLD